MGDIVHNSPGCLQDEGLNAEQHIIGAAENDTGFGVVVRLGCLAWSWHMVKLRTWRAKR